MKLSRSRFTQKFLLAASLILVACAFSKVYSQENTETAKWFNEKAWLNGLQLTPHKSIDQQELRKQYEANPQLWNKAFAYLKETNLAELKPGDKIIFEQNGKDVSVRPVRSKSVFAKYRGIGNPGMPSGRERVVRKVRELRGHASSK